MTVVAHSRPGTSLKREAYTSQRLLEAEIERLFLKNWLYFGHTSQIAKPGDYLARELVGENVLVTRLADGSLSATLNVCRHRGALLCQPGTGHAKRFTCPYHAWTFRLDGSLVPASAMDADGDFDAAEFGLWRVHMEVWRGMIFVALGEERPEPIGPSLEEVIPLAGKLDFDNMKQIAVREYVQECNWKLSVENFSECYHCGPVHPLLSKSLDVEWVYALQGDYPGVRYNSSGHVPRQGQVSFTRDGNYVCSKLFGAYGKGETPHDGFGVGMVTNPDMVAILFQADYGVVQDFLPISVDKTLFTTRWFVNADAVEGVDYDIDNVVDIWDVTNHEDAHVLATVQKGVQSRRYVPGPLSIRRETGNRALFDTYLEVVQDVYDDVTS